jgi:hypothetical protein
MSRPRRKPTASAKHRRPAASANHRRPTVSAIEVAETAVTGAGCRGAHHGGSGGRCAGARGGHPLNALPVEAQHIIRAAVLAFMLGVGGAVANTPAVAFAAPDDTSSSDSSSDSSSTSSSSSDSATNASSTDATSSTTSSGSPAGAPLGSTSDTSQSSVDSQTSSTADPRSGVVQSSGGAHTGSISDSIDTTASPEATPARTGVPSAVAAASPDEKPVLSRVAQERATSGASQRDSHTTPNAAGSAPTNRSGPASSSSADKQSTAIVSPAETPAATAEPLAETEAPVESVPASPRPPRVLQKRKRLQWRSVTRHRRAPYPTSCQTCWHRRA